MEQIGANYNIAELSVLMHPAFQPLTDQAVPYKCNSEGAPDCRIEVSENTYRRYESQFPTASRGLIEYMVTGSQFYNSLLLHSGILLHASAVEFEGKAYLFSAPSGTGKSTHTALWTKVFPEAVILNDDKPAIRVLSDGIYVYGTPWSGKSDLNLNKKVPLQGIAFLSRGKENEIFPLAAKEAIQFFFEQTVRPKELVKMNSVLDLIGQIVSRIPIYQMRCNISDEAPVVAYGSMKKGVIR